MVSGSDYKIFDKRDCQIYDWVYENPLDDRPLIIIQFHLIYIPFRC